MDLLEIRWLIKKGKFAPTSRHGRLQYLVYSCRKLDSALGFLFCFCFFVTHFLATEPINLKGLTVSPTAELCVAHLRCGLQGIRSTHLSPALGRRKVKLAFNHFTCASYFEGRRYVASQRYQIKGIRWNKACGTTKGWRIPLRILRRRGQRRDILRDR